MNATDKEFLRDTIRIAEAAFVQRELSLADGVQAKDQHSDLEKKIEAKKDVAEALARDPTIRARICAGLESASGNLRDLAKVVVAALIPLSAAGSIEIALTPMLAAAVVLIVFEAGTNAYCKDLELD